MLSYLDIDARLLVDRPVKQPFWFEGPIVPEGAPVLVYPTNESLPRQRPFVHLDHFPSGGRNGFRIMPELFRLQAFYLFYLIEGLQVRCIVRRFGPALPTLKRPVVKFCAALLANHLNMMVLLLLLPCSTCAIATDHYPLRASTPKPCSAALPW